MISPLQSMGVIDIFLLIVIIFYVVCCPFTKVEESFNMQALHDLLQFGFSIEAFDHHEFPGVVPRTFLGSLYLAAISSPFYHIMNFLEYTGPQKQMMCRIILGATTWASFVWFRSAIHKVFGNRTAQLFILLTIMQFHMCFYASRTLPNVFALNLCLISYGLWLKGKALASISVVAVAAIIFRCDMLVLLVPTVLLMLFTGEIKFWRSLAVGLAVSIAALLLTVVVDSFFWNRWLWAEGVVLFFNTVENKSSEWGVMPFHWYFTHAIPKAMNMVLPWIAVAVVGLQTKPNHKLSTPNQNIVTKVLGVLGYELAPKTKGFYYTTPSVVFVMLYSILPHKELRFILPVLPMLTMLGAVGLNGFLPAESPTMWYPVSELDLDHARIKQKAEDDDKKPAISFSLLPHLGSFAVLATCGIMVLLDNTFLMASYYNYPGGIALERLIHQHLNLHIVGNDQLTKIDRPLFVHIDTLAATSGVSRFGQERLLVPEADPALESPLAKKGFHYLNTSPQEWTSLLPQFNCGTTSWGLCGRDIVYYSKHEDVTDFTQYDFVITERAKSFFLRLHRAVSDGEDDCQQNDGQEHDAAHL